jgi:hypothetical protein
VRGREQSSLKNRYIEYQKELSIAEENIRMLRRMGQIESDLSKRKMRDFSREMGRYGKIARQSSKNIEVIDQLFYRQFKRQMLQEGKPERTSNKTHQRKLRKKLKSIHHPRQEDIHKAGEEERADPV